MRLIPRKRNPAGGVPKEEAGVTYLTDYDKARIKGRKTALSAEYGFMRKPPTDTELENRVRAYANQPVLAYADPENVARSKRKRAGRSRGAGRSTILGETLG